LLVRSPSRRRAEAFLTQVTGKGGAGAVSRLDVVTQAAAVVRNVGAVRAPMLLPFPCLIPAALAVPLPDARRGRLVGWRRRRRGEKGVVHLGTDGHACLALVGGLSVGQHVLVVRLVVKLPLRELF
jgi:hypothetical protein